MLLQRGLTMAKEYIKDFYGKVLGYLETQGTKTTVRDFYGKVLGTYDSRDNFTRDFYGKVISKGNTVVGLLYKNQK